ncbi:hypothetical protein C8J57DRAFT_1287967 [Mycena rebaudengoi]|nr:hypothetical protein C8J57DRAFT_1303595 [Mycena rebaudengoi]KAJ7286548.1 hypothetical protein C8J57DRAFT_1287967 [Mycena rebaudengoi]
MLTLFPISAALFLASCNVVAAQGQSSIPGLTDGQQNCLAICLFNGIPAAASCNPNDADLDAEVACFCGSAAYTSNVTQCASDTCNICTTGGCNITANPLVDACGNTGASGSPSGGSVSKASGSPTSTFSQSLTFSQPIGQTSSGGSSTSSGGAPTSSSAAMKTEQIKGVTLATVGLGLLGLVL